MGSPLIDVSRKRLLKTAVQVDRPILAEFLIVTFKKTGRPLST
jgi:hypothetical protein